METTPTHFLEIILCIDVSKLTIRLVKQIFEMSSSWNECINTEQAVKYFVLKNAAILLFPHLAHWNFERMVEFKPNHHVFPLRNWTNIGWTWLKHIFGGFHRGK